MVEKSMGFSRSAENERHAVNERGECRDGGTAARDGETGGQRRRWKGAAPRGSCCSRAPPAALDGARRDG